MKVRINVLKYIESNQDHPDFLLAHAVIGHKHYPASIDLGSVFWLNGIPEEWDLDVGELLAEGHAIAESETAGIRPEPCKAAMKLLAALTWLLDDLADAEEDRNPETGEEYDSIAFARAARDEAKAACIRPEPPAPNTAATEMYDTLRYVAEMLSGFKPDFLRNIGLDVALEKTEAALHAAETSKA